MEQAKLLLVDYRPEKLEAMERLLAGEERVFYRATSSEEALRHVSLHHFAVAILELQMPEMDGIALAERIRSLPESRTLPIIFVSTGTRDQSLVFQGFEAGAVAVMYEPLNEHMLKN